MRMSMLAILVSVGAGSLMALPALAVQDQPTTQNGVETVCTGVGSAKDNPAWSGYPVKLTFSNMSGENEAMEHVSITQGGKAVLGLALATCCFRELGHDSPAFFRVRDLRLQIVFVARMAINARAR